MRKLLPLVAALPAACATAVPEPAVVGAGPFLCRDFASAQFIGREATSALGAELQRASGARVIRWVQPGMMVTMEFREDRLTVRLDERNRVQSASCG